MYGYMEVVLDPTLMSCATIIPNQLVHILLGFDVPTSSFIFIIFIFLSIK